MRIHQSQAAPKPTAGYALIMTILFLAIGLLALTSVLELTSTEAKLTERNNLYNASVAAAEGATEMVLAQMDRDFINQSVSANLATYRSLQPDQGAWPIKFAFSDYSGTANQTGVNSLGPAVVANLDSQFSGLYGLVAPYQVVSTARPLGTALNVSASVSQTIQLASIPIFQFAIFYGMDLEINPGAPMVITGKVHSNANIYTAPPASLEFLDDVTAVGNIYNDRDPNDPTGGAKTTPTYDQQHMDHVSSLSLPIGANNDPDLAHQILDPPPPGEDPNSPLGKERYYNNADLIISNGPSGITVTAGAWDNFAPVAPDVTNGPNAYYSFINNAAFYDNRENKTVQATDVNVGKLNAWLANAGSTLNGLAAFAENHGINSIYVIDSRPQSGSGLNAARVSNGAQLPDAGLTVATPMPLYVEGNYNLNNGTDAARGQTDTANTKPASLVGDAITVLSGNWNDNNGQPRPFGQRQASDTTVNAAFLAGIVESTDAGGVKNYSGGVENFPRLLENWSSKALTYNGSMVVLFPSRYATNSWRYGGPVYTAAQRLWSFDVNFLKQSGLPPLTPQVRKLVRGSWQILAPPPGG